MPYVNHKNLGLTSVSDIAEVIGLSVARTRQLVGQGTLPRPQTLAGSRYYYSPEEVEAIVKRVKEHNID